MACVCSGATDSHQRMAHQHAVAMAAGIGFLGPPGHRSDSHCSRCPHPDLPSCTDRAPGCGCCHDCPGLERLLPAFLQILWISEAASSGWLHILQGSLYRSSDAVAFLHGVQRLMGLQRRMYSGALCCSDWIIVVLSLRMRNSLACVWLCHHLHHMRSCSIQPASASTSSQVQGAYP